MCFAPKVKFTLSSLILYGLFSLILFRCASISKSVAPVSVPKKTNKIVFMNYDISKDNNGNIAVKFINSKLAEGVLKEKTQEVTLNNSSQDLICNQLDASSKILSQKRITDPLKKIIEYVDENKHFNVKTISLDATKFSVRLQLYENTAFINIVNAANTPLVTTKRSRL